MSNQPYAICKAENCGLEFANKEAASAHSRATMAPTSRVGLVASGHPYVVVNPTPEEVQERRVRSAIESALEDLYSEIDDQVRRGDFTEAEVTEQMRWFDLGDGWDDYTTGGEGA